MENFWVINIILMNEYKIGIGIIDTICIINLNKYLFVL